jgi:hypothetical protein
VHSPEPSRSLRARAIDWLLILAALIGALWLGSLLYHNYFGGHVERDDAAGNAAVSSAPVEDGPAGDAPRDRIAAGPAHRFS